MHIIMFFFKENTF